MRYYSKNELDQLGETILEDYYKAFYTKENEVVPIENIIEKMYKLKLEYDHLSEDKLLLGFTVFNDGKVPIFDNENNCEKYIYAPTGTIFIALFLADDEKQVGRYRFTCAHELAHWILHKDFFMGKQDMVAMHIEKVNNRMEWQANYLGSSLLMPLQSFYRNYRCLRKLNSEEATVAELANIYCVSKQAVEIRIRNLAYVKS